jgi:hypothetical protein
MTGAATLRSPARFDATAVPGAKPAPFPGFVEPCHPTLREEAPSGERWVHEIKFDGYRAQAHLLKARNSVVTSTQTTRSGAMLANHPATGGLRSNHGRAFSSCPARRKSVASSP